MWESKLINFDLLHRYLITPLSFIFQGDSGGPLVNAEGYQIGVASHATDPGCAAGDEYPKMSQREYILT